ncbi:Octanoyltransferase LipM [Rubripirellula amarantea]|uniref:Octanoyltransferase LipM n=2 Tax=Rubripirellula amarantea TaxID=2527999 RepID=A0A5C5WR34_9BACT|nr:Octanoyltransferase LipM [Rubripirellula amarantea]
MAPADNMALDQALLESMDRLGAVNSGQSVDSSERVGSSERGDSGRSDDSECGVHEDGHPTHRDAVVENELAAPAACLRFYTWKVPTLSLGYFQAYDQRGQHVPSQSAACVRRASGGGAILHEHELTYSLVVRNVDSRRGADAELYQKVHRVIANVLSGIGVTAIPFYHSAAYHRTRTALASNTDGQARRDQPFLCFQRRTEQDLIVAGYKVLGSAQRRGRVSVLQHGSLLVRASSLAPELPGIRDLGAKVGVPRELISPIADQLGQELNLNLVASQPTQDELARMAEIADERFGSDAWMHRR